MDALTPRLPRILGRARRRVLLHRRGLAAFAAAAAVFAGLQAAAPPPPPTTPVWTAARDLPGGAVLERGDLRRVDLDPDTAPDDVATPADLVGRTLVAPLVQGTPLSSRSVLGDGLLAGHPGLAAVPVRISDPEVAGLLRVGDRVALMAAVGDADGDARLLAADALVLALPRGRFDTVSAGLSGRIVVIGIAPVNIGEVVAAQSGAFVTAVWTG